MDANGCHCDRCEPIDCSHDRIDVDRSIDDRISMMDIIVVLGGHGRRNDPMIISSKDLDLFFFFFFFFF